MSSCSGKWPPSTSIFFIYLIITPQIRKMFNIRRKFEVIRSATPVDTTPFEPKYFGLFRSS